MLLRKELESLELTYPDESITVSNTSETGAVSTSKKIFPFRKVKKIPLFYYYLSKIFNIQRKKKYENKMVLFKQKNDLKCFSEFTKKSVSPISEGVPLRRDENNEKPFQRQQMFEEPDSMDSIISDPTSFPITVVPPASPGGAGLLIRNSTQTSFSRLSRISTSSKYVYFICVIINTRIDKLEYYRKMCEITQTSYRSSVYPCDYEMIENVINKLESLHQIICPFNCAKSSILFFY